MYIYKLIHEEEISNSGTTVLKKQTTLLELEEDTVQFKLIYDIVKQLGYAKTMPLLNKILINKLEDSITYCGYNENDFIGILQMLKAVPKDNIIVIQESFK